MIDRKSIAAGAAALALLAVPTVGLASPGKSGDKGKSTAPGLTKAPSTTDDSTRPADSPDAVYGLPKGNAYGVRCRGFSKKHVKGEKGTPFSRCVVAMAQLDKGKTKSVKKACKGLSKKKSAKKVKGKTPYAACVKAGKALLREKKQQKTS